ncbi:MAG TPA: DUF952 domain-containing protein [Burkholderiales bacterium]|nr:DUF952 domain-containing protein [Burkholderiales bacterium]
MSGAALVYKVLRAPEWAQMQARGVFEGSADDQRDGFIHCSTAEQLEGTIERHFAGERDLMVLEVDAAALGDGLKWEPSRGGALFPHLYGELPLSAVLNRRTR